MFRKASDHQRDLLQRQRALSRWEDEGGATQSDSANLYGLHADAGRDAKAVPRTEIEVDAVLIGKGLELEPSLVQRYMREGAITSLCERGIGEDEGRYRLTFYFGKRRFRILTDWSGNVIPGS